MAEFPALPLWTDAFLSDTMHLDATETGAYLLLLMTAWRRPNNDLPDDDVQLRRFARCSAKTWKTVRPRVMAFWSLKDGTWHQKKLDSIREGVRTLQIKKRHAANVRWSNPLTSNKSFDADGSRLHSSSISNQNQNQNQKSLKSLFESSKPTLEELQAKLREKKP
jgi:uncharacterized protein YdaU (DUF1376 family)